jgi:predicted nucleic acid-binding protein
VIVLDASAMLELLLDTEPGARVADRALAGRDSLHAPHLIDLEVAHAVHRFERLGEIAPQRASEALRDLVRLPLQRHGHAVLLGRVRELRHSCSAYDAAYVALAEALAAPLLTRDARLARSHGHRARIELL